MKNKILLIALLLSFLFSPCAFAESEGGFFSFFSKLKSNNEESEEAKIKPKAHPSIKIEEGSLQDAKSIILDSDLNLILNSQKAPYKKINRKVQLQQDSSKNAIALNIAVGNSEVININPETREIIIANPAVADIKIVNKNLAYLNGTGIGDTNVILLDGSSKILTRFNVSVNVSSESLAGIYKKLFPEEKIDVLSTKDSLVISGSVSSDAIAKNVIQVANNFVTTEKIVNMLGIKDEQQVLLKVRVAEMQRSVLKEFGLNTSFNQNKNSWLLNWAGVTNTGLSAGGLGVNSLYGATLSKGSFSAVMQALETQGLIKTLAEPNLTAVSGEKADLLAGGEYPIPVFDQEGNVTFTFKPYGISLAFTPVILSSGRISLKLSTEVSSIADLEVISGATVPTMNTRRFGTTVEIPSGGSLMIGGLLQNDTINNSGGVPGIQNIPILGALFRSQSFRKNETELVVTISGYIVEPRSENEFASPSDGFVPAGDLNRLLLGGLYKTYRDKNSKLIKGALKGPIGYSMR
ncbi:MAG: type II and III secretion system protein family protein [Alphaproteobacteria bacterium]